MTCEHCKQVLAWGQGTALPLLCGNLMQWVAYRKRAWQHGAFPGSQHGLALPKSAEISSAADNCLCLVCRFLSLRHSDGLLFTKIWHEDAAGICWLQLGVIAQGIRNEQAQGGWKACLMAGMGVLDHSFNGGVSRGLLDGLMGGRCLTCPLGISPSTPGSILIRAPASLPVN